jgi:hypothetical protein
MLGISSRVARSFLIAMVTFIPIAAAVLSFVSFRMSLEAFDACILME